MSDKSNGYEGIADAFVRARRLSIGPSTVAAWAAERLKPGCAVLDLGCGHGVPISKTLIEQGFKVYGVDASQTLVAKFRERFPEAAVECCPVEESSFFHRTFDGVVAWGLMFLLNAETQRSIIGKVARVLNPGGQFLFTSPSQTCSWNDGMTGLPSVSPGRDFYIQAMAEYGLTLLGNDEDEGDNYYYFACKPATGWPTI